MKKRTMLLALVLVLGGVAGCGQPSRSDEDVATYTEEETYEASVPTEEIFVEQSAFTEKSISESAIGSEKVSSEQDPTLAQEEVFQSEIPEAYREVLDRIDGYFREEIAGNEEISNSSYESRDDDEKKEFSALDEVCRDSKKAMLFHFGYALYDIDGNGIQELIIAADRYYAGSDISLIYTIEGGKAKCLIAGWSRCRVTLLENGMIYNEGSSGAAYSNYITYQIDEEENSLNIVDCYFSDYSVPGKEETWGWFHSTTKSEVNNTEGCEKVEEETVQQFREYFVAQPRKQFDLTYFIEYENAGAPDKILASVEEISQSLTKRLETETLTQVEMERISEQIYQLWDDELNYIWRHLKSNLDEETMQKLTEAERDWIAYKDAQIQAIGVDAAGSSMQIMLQNEKGTYLTRDRVYELYEYLE